MVDAIVSGVHEPGESHYELLRAFAGDNVLERLLVALEQSGYRSHEFGDSVLLERQLRTCDLLHLERLPVEVEARCRRRL